MEAHTPLAQANGPTVPTGPAAAAAPPTAIPQAPPAPGIAQPTPAAPPRRNRNPRGPVEPTTRTTVQSAPALLEIGAASPFSTEQRRSCNFFFPDAQMLFHVLSICDQMMNSTERFLRSSPAWMPIVSQLYISVLWNVMILKVLVISGYGSAFVPFLSELSVNLKIDECVIPGPLVPFFQALAAINGPFDWIGDIVPALPSFPDLWNAENFSVRESFARLIPIPAIILDQLHAFSQFAIPPNQVSSYATFQWYRSIFSVGTANVARTNKLGPQLCGSLFTSQHQYDAARNFWNASLETGITRINAAAGQPVLTNYRQLFGFESQNGTLQLSWFTSASIAMNKYTQFFNGSVPLKSISLSGIGAVVILGKPNSNPSVRNWLYPTNAAIEPFLTSRYPPRREIPDALAVTFHHSDHEIEAQAEQYAILTHINVDWSANNETQHDWTRLAQNATHLGDYWIFAPHRHSGPIQIKAQFPQIIASRYHQQAANRAE